MIFRRTIEIKGGGLRASSTSAFQSLSKKYGLNETVTKPGQQYDESFVSSEEYQLLHKSPVHTFKYQKSLSRLPIPKLEETCKRYLNSQKAITDDPDAYKKTESLVMDFMKTEGVRMQNSFNSIRLA